MLTPYCTLLVYYAILTCCYHDTIKNRYFGKYYKVSACEGLYYPPDKTYSPFLPSFSYLRYFGLFPQIKTSNSELFYYDIQITAVLYL